MGKQEGELSPGGGSPPLCCRVVDALGDPFHVVDRDYNLVLVSRSCRQWCQSLGVQSPQEGQSLWQGFPFLPPAVRDEYRQVFQSGQPMVTEEPTVVDGREVFTETHKIPLAGQDGQVECVLTVIRDVTEGKRAETALRRGEEQLRAIMSSLSETAIVVMDRDARMLSVWISPEMARRLGRSQEEIRLRLPTEIYVGPVGEARVARIQELFRTGEPARDEYLADLPGGRFWLESSLSPVRGANGEVTAVVSFVRDITAQKQAMAALQESEAKYRFLLENVNDIVYSMDAARHLTYVSSQIGALGLASEDVLGRDCVDLVVPEDRPSAAASLRRLLAGEGEFPLEFRAMDSRGQVHWFEARGRRRVDGSGAVELNGVLRDVTERKLAEEALRSAHGMMLKAREEERRRLARELHDSVGQALIAMHMRLGSFRTEAGAGLAPAMLARLDSIAEHCNALIREVRQISYGLFPAALEQLGLMPALRQLLSICSLAGIEGGVQCSPDQEAVRFGRDVEVALFRIAQEAVNNAMRHAACRRVAVELCRLDGCLLLTVSDDGQGFAPARPARSGIGLASMRERAEAIGGQVRISSGPDGTVIEAQVPLPPASTPT